MEIRSSEKYLGAGEGLTLENRYFGGKIFIEFYLITLKPPGSTRT